MGVNHLDITIADTVEEAPDYKKLPEFKGAKLVRAVIVRNGTKAGNDTVDLQFEDDKGNKYIAMITAKLLKSVTSMTITDKD